MKKILLLTMASFAVASNIRNSRVLGATGSAATGSAETEQPLSATGDAEVPQTNKNAVWVSCFNYDPDIHLDPLSLSLPGILCIPFHLYFFPLD